MRHYSGKRNSGAVPTFAVWLVSMPGHICKLSKSSAPGQIHMAANMTMYSRDSQRAAVDNSRTVGTHFQDSWGTLPGQLGHTSRTVGAYFQDS